jgi:F0F1-type ATP synthase membrane subunit b/b'
MKTLFLEKIKTIIKNYYLYIIIACVFIWVTTKSIVSKNKKVEKTIDKNKDFIHSNLEEIQANNIKLTQNEIEHEIKNTKIEKDADEIRVQVDNIISNTNLTSYQKNKELNELHNSIKKFK